VFESKERGIRIKLRKITRYTCAVLHYLKQLKLETQLCFFSFRQQKGSSVFASSFFTATTTAATSRTNSPFPRRAFRPVPSLFLFFLLSVCVFLLVFVVAVVVAVVVFVAFIAVVVFVVAVVVFVVFVVFVVGFGIVIVRVVISIGVVEIGEMLKVTFVKRERI